MKPSDSTPRADAPHDRDDAPQNGEPPVAAAGDADHAENARPATIPFPQVDLPGGPPSRRNNWGPQGRTNSSWGPGSRAA